MRIQGSVRNARTITRNGYTGGTAQTVSTQKVVNKMAVFLLALSFALSSVG